MQINLNMVPKRYLLGRGLFLLVILGLIIGAVHPYKPVLGSPPIGGELGISEITVKAHRGQVMQKMKAESLAALVKIAAKLGTARESGSSPAPIDSSQVLLPRK